jgi:dolichol kinase
MLLRRFTDERDSGPLILTHMYLLLGCALPLWINLISHSGSGSISYSSSKSDFVDLLVNLAGVLMLGIGDTMASLLGTRYGRHRLHAHTKKTLEGTIGSIVSVLFCTYLLDAFVFGA